MTRPIAARTFNGCVFAMMDDNSIWQIPLSDMIDKMNICYSADDLIFRYPVVHNDGMMIQWNQEIAITNYHIEKYGTQVTCTDEVSDAFFFERLCAGRFVFDEDSMSLDLLADADPRKAIRDPFRNRGKVFELAGECKEKGPAVVGGAGPKRSIARRPPRSQRIF